MPLKKCMKDGKSGWKWGDSGKCYTGPDAKKKALAQGLAIEGPEKFAKLVKMSSIDGFVDELDEVVRYSNIEFSDLCLILDKVLTTKEKNDLPDSAFAIILPGGKKDKEGKTVPRSLRKFPLKVMKNGKLVWDKTHIINALARLSQSKLTKSQKIQVLKKIKQGAKQLGINVTLKESDL